MHRPKAIQIPVLGDIDSRVGLRDSFRRVHDFITRFCRGDYDYKEQLANEMRELYGEQTFSFSNLGNGGATSCLIAVPGAQVGYPVQGGFSLPLTGIVSSFHVNANGQVLAVFQNLSGQAFNASGKIRVWVLPKELA